MLYWVILLVMFSAIVGTEAVVVCDGLVFHGVYFDKELLFEGMGKPYNLVMHTYTGQLFFSHTIWNGTTVDFGVMACHIEKKTCREIPGIAGGYAVGHDRTNDDIFFGGHNGIYKYNFQTRSAKYFAEKHRSIWGLCIDTYFYYIEYPTQRLFVYDHNKFVPVRSAKNMEIDNFFVARDKRIYFSNITGLFKVDKAFRDTIVLERNILVRQIVEDMYGDVYFCGVDGIYVEVSPYNRIKKVANIDNSYGIAFMKVYTSKTPRDLVIYSSKDSIYRLLPSKYSEICLDAIKKDKKHKQEFSRIIQAH